MPESSGNGLTLREYVDLRFQALEKRFDRLDHAQERTEAFGQTVMAEWTKWRGTIDTAQIRLTERKAVYAALVVSGLTLFGVVANAILRIMGH